MNLKSLTLLFVGLLFACTSAYAQERIAESGMKWYSLEEAQKIAKEEGKKVLIFGYAEWCTYCRKMRREVYPDSTLQSTIYDYYVPVELNSESDEDVVFNGQKIKGMELARYLRLTSLPTHYFVDSEGKILGAQPGFLPQEVFDPLLRYVGTDSFGTMDFEKFMEGNQ
ncbi:thioredoxin family protein [Balneola sp. MJW-20]|uniref:thioredoxin family protein n=1 Tax=Gracilimonas aurantiaca TaxID=3234185 RepID=UPI00346771C2